MMLVIMDEAEREFLADAAFYELKEPGLGTRFRNEVASAVDWISQNYEKPSLRPEVYRRLNLRVFPHYIAYVIDDDVISVVAIAHSKRLPEYWLHRI